MPGYVIALIVIGVIVLLLVFYVVSVYNKLIDLRNKVKDQWAQIEVQLKRRFDLIPNVVETVKGYATHEEGTLTAVIEARNKFVSATDINSEIDASNMLTGALSKLFALTESYPDLKANTNFLQLQTELKETEDKIASARMFYNDIVLKFNNQVEQFPTNLIAGMFQFKVYEFFNAGSEAQEAPKVDFNK